MKIKHPSKEYQIFTPVIPEETAKLQVDPKRSCKHCYGRGYQFFVEGDGYKMVEKKIPKLRTGIGAVVEYSTVIQRVEDLKRNALPCVCTFRHARFIARAEAAKATILKKYKIK